MKIHWNNLVATAFVIAALTLLLRYGKSIASFFTNIKNIGSGHSTDEQTMGLIGLAFLVAAFIAVFRLLLNNKNN